MYRKVFASRVSERKVVRVAGACAGLGRAQVMRFAQAGARLFEPVPQPRLPGREPGSAVR